MTALTSRQRVLAYALRMVAVITHNTATPCSALSWNDCLTQHPTRPDCWMMYYNDTEGSTHVITGQWPEAIE